LVARLAADLSLAELSVIAGAHKRIPCGSLTA
jgi:hypothetical protein